MKKFATLSSLLLLALNSCSSEDIINEELPNSFEKQISVVAEDLVPAAGTRTSYTDNGNGYSFAWSEGDALGIFPTSGHQTDFPIGADGVGSNTAVFDGGKWALRPNESYAAYYPLIHDFDLNLDAIPVDYTGQIQNGNGSTSHLSAYDFMASNYTEVDAKGNVNFKLQHLGCLVQFVLNMPEEDTYSSMEIVSDKTPFITSGEYSLSDNSHVLTKVQESQEITIGLNEVSTTSDNKTLTITAMFAPVDLSESRLTLTIKGSSKDYTIIMYGQNLQTGKAVAVGGINDTTPYVTFQAEAEQTFMMSKEVEALEYSVNNSTWTLLGTNTVTFGGINGNLRLRGSNGYGTGTAAASNSPNVVFGTEASVECSGDIRTLADYANYLTEDTSDDLFCNLFNGCSALISAPELPANMLGETCYGGMFLGCRSLTCAPALPAKKIAGHCYAAMFYECRSLTSAPELPATTLAEFCYESMFSYCISLTSAPKLPAERRLGEYCYAYMFKGCIALTNAPELPAYKLADHCYTHMFEDCMSLNYIKMLAPDIPETDLMDNWVLGVASTGTFVKSKDATWDITGPSGVPEGWTVKYVDENGNEVDDTPYVTFSAKKPQTLTMIYNGSMPLIESIEYSVNGSKWEALGTNTVDFGAENGELRLRGKSPIGTAKSVYNYAQISFGEKSVEVSCTGDIRTLVNYENYKTVDTSKARFCSLFSHCTSLTSTPELPAETLAKDCYERMFLYCTSLTSAPELPAKTLAEGCYEGMFQYCTSLTSAPELPAETLAGDCYVFMFYGCTSLSNVPQKLPAKVLATYCYEDMFHGCTALTNTPELPAKTLAEGCYMNMFSGCTALSSAPELPAETLSEYCYNNMFYGCTSLTSAPMLPAKTLAEGCYSFMFSGCSMLTTAPELPALTLVTECYDNMFSYCKKLNYVKMNATNITASNCLGNWLGSVASTGTFVKNPNANWSDSGVVPSGWTVTKAAQ